jgi:hypothetical protein
MAEHVVIFYERENVMRARMMVLSVSCLLILTCTLGYAQDGRRGYYSSRPSVLKVAVVPAVAEELKLNEKQTALAKKLRDENCQQRDEIFQGFGDLSGDERRERFQQYSEQRTDKEQQLAKSLGEEKFKRVQQLTYQAAGFSYLILNRETAEKLEVSDEQRTQAFESLRDLRDEFNSAGDDEEAWKELRKKVNEKVEAVLSDDQKSKWKKLLGKPAAEELLANIQKAMTQSS